MIEIYGVENMAKIIVGISAVFVAKPAHGFLLNILVQNLSANSLYLGKDASVTIDSGIKITASGGVWSDDKRADAVYLIADGADSDVRVQYEVYREGTR